MKSSISVGSRIGTVYESPNKLDRIILVYTAIKDKLVYYRYTGFNISICDSDENTPFSRFPLVSEFRKEK